MKVKAEVKVERPSTERLEELGISAWSIWECELSTFPWHYRDRIVPGQYSKASGNSIASNDSLIHHLASYGASLPSSGRLPLGRGWRQGKKP
jgi:hypothetical protein